MTSSYFVANLGAYLSDASKLSEDDFVREHPEPCLWVEPFKVEDEPQLATSAGEAVLGQVPFVLPIRARDESHGYGDRITLGRTGNNDLVLRSSDVSKIHGYFLREGDKTSYVDVHSSYGSSLEGEPVQAGRPVELRDGAKLAFASVVTSFHDARGLYRRLLRAGEPE